MDFSFFIGINLLTTPLIYGKIYMKSILERVTFTKFNWNKKYTTISMYCLGVIALSVLFVVFVFKFDSFAAGFSWVGSVSAPIICGICIAYILNPLVKWIENKFFRKLRDGKPPKRGIVMKTLHKSPVGDTKIVHSIEEHSPKPEQKVRRRKGAARALSIFIAYVVVIAVLFGLGFAVVPSVAKSVVDLADQMPGYIARSEEWLQETFANNPELAKIIAGEFDDIADLLNNVANMVKPMATDIIGNVGTGIFKFASAVFVALKNVLIGFIIAIYLLYSKERLLAQVKKIFFAFFKPERCQRIFSAAGKSNKIFTQYIISNIVDALLIFMLMLVGMLLMGMPYPMLIAVVCGVTNLIPFFGPFIGAIPSAILILLVDPIKVIWFAIFVLVLQQVDGNIIKPLMFGETMGLPAIWVLVSIIVGGGMFGIPGMLLGAPVFAVFYLLFAEFVSGRLVKKDLPTETDDYTDTIDKFSEQYLKPKQEPDAAEE